MEKLLFWIFTLVVLTQFVYGSEEYGDCVVYNEDEDMDDTKDHYCLEPIDGKIYCKEWDCLPTKCTNPGKEKGNKCQYCPGTCNYGGKIHYLYERFTCPDGVNACSCKHNNAVIWSNIKVHSPDRMCKP